RVPSARPLNSLFLEPYSPKSTWWQTKDCVMSDQIRSRLILEHPIGDGLKGFRATFTSICEGADLRSPDEAIDRLKREDVQDLASSLLTALQILPTARLLSSNSGGIVRNLVDAAAAESTPPPRTIASSLQQTPWLHKTSSFANSSEYRQDVDRVFKSELGPLEKLVTFLADYVPVSAHLRRPLAQPNKPAQGSTAERKLDIGFVSDTGAGKDTRCQWSQILVPGELKSNPAADTASKAWLDLGRYAREVLAAQDTRRFVLGFTICGSFMRIWALDRLGGVASERFDINEDGLQFVSTILGFLWMSEEDCGFDPTIITKEDHRDRAERSDRTSRPREIDDTGTLHRRSSNNMLESAS
ncbi:hypothetical protein N7522_001431, partial [Penicillium canescens]